MKDIVRKTIANLEKIKEERVLEQDGIHGLLEDDVIITIDNMIEVLKFEYLMKK